MNDVTRILVVIEQGDPRAADQLLPLVYDELRRLAGSETARPWDGRGHFFAAAAEAMRRILVENARRKQSRKHGGDQRRADLDLDALVAPGPEMDLLALDAALDRLAQRDPQKARLVELRYFAGLTGDQAAAFLGISPSTADRQWTYTRAWLRRELGLGAGP